MLELFQTLVKKTFEDPSIPNFYLDNAEKAILNYTGLEYLNEDYNIPIVMLAVHFYSSGGTSYSIAEGNKKITNFSNIIPPQVKALLPYPRLKVM